MLLGFKAQFADLVERREKTQSIRARGDRFKVGGHIQLYTGLRTKACRKLVADDPVCLSVEPVVIHHHWMEVDGRRLLSTERIEMAHADGFAGYWDFATFFADQQNHTLPWRGFLIKWGWP